MIDLLQQHHDPIEQLCREYRVARLAVFGSAAQGRLDDSSDIDLLVAFQPMPPVVYMQSYFALADALEKLLGRRVDLVTEPSIRNHYFQQAVDRTAEPLYAA